MATINFYLDKPDKKGFAPIHLRINCNGSQVKVSTGQKIEPKNFNKSKQKADWIKCGISRNQSLFRFPKRTSG